MFDFNRPDLSWREFERQLSSGTGSAGQQRSQRRVADHANGGDSPAWSRKRPPYQPPAPTKQQAPAKQAQAKQQAQAKRPSRTTVPYAELHCHSNFSFLDGASHPEELVEEAMRLELDAVALTDHDGMYGVVRFAEAAAAHGLPTVFGTELSLGLTEPQNGFADPEGSHLVVLARDPQGYASLCRAVSEAQLAGREKG
ncbi:MAG: error-prone polymerase, partial [Acidimicrobiaceae bacterium]|nr:error-prone polymerase [Acidimicrobiaceae bacterium]